jgi:ribosomal protein L11 methyltransferase
VIELTLRVGAGDAEEVLDSVLPTLPGGAHVREAGEAVLLTIAATPGTPDEEELRRLVGSRLIDLTAAEASDDWRERRLARYQPLIVAERFLLRPEWAPPGESPDLIEIVLEQGPAFGTGLHPTTQACLATMAEIEAGGSFSDIGCGSGVLSIAAAKLGWSPIVAIDVDPNSIRIARGNADRNGVAIDARRVDVASEPAPGAETVVANVPPVVQLALAESLDATPSLLIASGFKPDEIPAVATAWEGRELSIADEVQANEWSVLVMRP